MIIIAGCAYPEGDLYLFDAVCAAIEKAALSPREAAQLAVALADTAADAGDREALDMAVFWFPGVAPLRSLLTVNAARARQVLQMLDVVLWEHGRRRDSGVLPSEHQRVIAS